MTSYPEKERQNGNKLSLQDLPLQDLLGKGSQGQLFSAVPALLPLAMEISRQDEGSLCLDCRLA